MVGIKASDAFMCSERIIKVLVARQRQGDEWKPLAEHSMHVRRGKERCEDAGGMQRNMFFFGFHYLAPSGQSFGCLCCCCFFCFLFVALNVTGDKCTECGET